jgi:tagatose 6-phosphate kinase
MLSVAGVFSLTKIRQNAPGYHCLRDIMIVCVGTTPALQRTLTFATVTLDAVNRALEVRETASGKSVNVARVLRELGEDALALGFLGGERSAFFKADLDQAGVPHDFVETAATTRICSTLLDQTSMTATELVEEPRSVTPEECRALFDKIDQALGIGELMVLSGSLAPGVSKDFYQDCIQRARRAGIRVILDAAGEPLTLALAERPFLVKPNRLELEHASGLEIRSDKALILALRAIVPARADWAAVTLGADGILLSDGRDFQRIATPGIRAVNPIGSGDAVAAGFASAIARGWPVPEAARFAAACGAANALTDCSGHVRRHDVERILPSVAATPYR